MNSKNDNKTTKSVFFNEKNGPDAANSGLAVTEKESKKV